MNEKLLNLVCKTRKLLYELCIVRRDSEKEFLLIV